MPNTRAVGELVDFFKVLLRKLERLGSNIGNIFANQFAGIDGGLVNFLKQEAAERLDT